MPRVGVDFFFSLLVLVLKQELGHLGSQRYQSLGILKAGNTSYIISLCLN